MSTFDEFFKQIDRYHPLSQETKSELLAICHIDYFKKNDLLLQAGDRPQHYYFIQKGLLGYYLLDENGDTIYKMFFEENSFVASTAAIIEEQASKFNIVALEDVQVISYRADKFRQLINKHHDLALFHLHYLEKNWVVKKEPLEINLKRESAKQRYLKMLDNPSLISRIKQHQIASYLGITPTQLSRIRKDLNL